MPVNARPPTIGELIASGAIIAHKDGNYGSNYPRVDEFGSEGVPFLTAKSLRDGFVDIAGAPRLSEARADELRFGFVKTDDVLLSHNATIGRVAVVPPHEGRLLVGTSLTYFRLNPQKLLPRYLAVYLTGSEFQNQLIAVMSHSTRNQVPVTAQRKLHVVVPSLAEQEAIARALGTLDDKIELNRRMNETLEGMARALFKSWFVDFDPVRAKLDGRPTGLDPATAALFPDHFEHTELGLLPRGWTWSNLASLASLILGGDWGSEVPNEKETLPANCIRGADIPDLQAGGLGKMPRRYLSAGSLEKRSLWHGDIVIEISGGSPTQSTGRPVLVTASLLSRLGAPLTCSNFCRLFRPTHAELSRFLYFYLRWLYDTDEFLQYENGTTGIKNFAFTVFADVYKFVVPSPEVLKAFDRTVGDWMKLRERLADQSATLAAVRDGLLPKLLSGEIRICDEKNRLAGAAAHE